MRLAIDTLLRKCFSYGDLVEGSFARIDSYFIDAQCRSGRCISDATPGLKRSHSAADVRSNEGPNCSHDITVLIGEQHHLEAISSDDGHDMQVSPSTSMQQLGLCSKALAGGRSSSMSLHSQDSSSATMLSRTSSIAADGTDINSALQRQLPSLHGAGVCHLETSASAISLTSCDVLGRDRLVPAMGASPLPPPLQPTAPIPQHTSAPEPTGHGIAALLQVSLHPCNTRHLQHPPAHSPHSPHQHSDTPADHHHHHHPHPTLIPHLFQHPTPHSPTMRLSPLSLRSSARTTAHSSDSESEDSDSEASFPQPLRHPVPAQLLKPHLSGSFAHSSAPSHLLLHQPHHQRSIFDDLDDPAGLPLAASRSSSMPPLRGELTPLVGSSCAASPRSHCSMSGCESEEQQGRESWDGEAGRPAALLRVRGQIARRSSYHLTHGSAAVELFYRLNHARQTMDFAKRQAQMFAALDHACMGLWEALQLLGELREYEAALHAESGQGGGLDPDMPLLEHAFQTAELCRLAHPELDWLHLAGLIHGLGKLLAHQRFGCQPQWAVCGETFPVGCRFDDQLPFSQYFSVNPDRRRRIYNTQLGIYSPGCGLSSVYMRWSASEYLHMVAVLNGDTLELPDAALFMIRHHKFTSLTRHNSPYLQLLSEDERPLLPLLREFQQATVYRRVELPEGALTGEALHRYYQGLIDKYTGGRPIMW